MNTKEEVSKPIFKTITVLWILIFWSVVSYFTWKPLIIPLLVLFSGYGATYLRNRLVYGSYLRSVVSGSIWGIFLSLALYYLVNLTLSSVWWGLMNYILGFFAAAYIGYRGVVETAILKNSRLESLYITAQFSSIILYILFLLLLSLHVGDLTLF